MCAGKILCGVRLLGEICQLSQPLFISNKQECLDYGYIYLVAKWRHLGTV